jgi:hypothetical protein
VFGYEDLVFVLFVFSLIVGLFVLLLLGLFL